MSVLNQSLCTPDSVQPLARSLLYIIARQQMKSQGKHFWKTRNFTERRHVPTHSHASRLRDDLVTHANV